MATNKRLQAQRQKAALSQQERAARRERREVRNQEVRNQQKQQPVMKERPKPQQPAETAGEGSESDKRLDSDSDSYRVVNEVLTRQRDKAIREAHAYKAMLAAHNIDVSMVSSDVLEKIRVVEGEAVDRFDYAAPGFVGQRVSPSAVDSRQAGQALNVDAIRNMSASEINKNWESVKQVLAAQRSK